MLWGKMNNSDRNKNFFSIFSFEEVIIFGIIICFFVVLLISSTVLFYKKIIKVETEKSRKILNIMCINFNQGYFLQNNKTNKIAFISSNLSKMLNFDVISLKDDFVDTIKKIFNIDSLDIIEPIRILYLNNNESLTLELSKNIIKFENMQTYNCFIINDITQNVRRENELEEALEKTEIASMAKGNFLSRMSHEIRTPIQGIIGMNHMAKKMSEDLAYDHKIIDYLNKVDSSSRYLLGLLNQILDMSKIESSKMEVYKAFINTNNILDSIISTITPQLEYKNLTLEKYIDIKSNMIYVDEMKLMQIIVNILSNAVKFSSSNNKIIFKFKENIIEPGKSAFHIEIIDFGIGMSDKFLNKLFEPFTQYSEDIAIKYGGSGLGLAICKTFVDYLEGTIKCESKLNLGTKFELDFVFEVCEELAIIKKEEKLFDFSSCNVLLVEDNPINVEVVSFLLRTNKCNVYCVNDGIEAIKNFKDTKLDFYNFILMDLQMIGKNGFETAREIRSLNRSDSNIPIIAMSASTFESDIMKCYEYKMNGYISKPVHPNTFVEKISNILNEL